MKKITILLLAIAAIASGCKKFTDVNNNPNQPTVVTPNVVLSAALVASGSNLANNFQNTARWMGYWSRSGNYIETVPTETYDIQPDYADADFQSLYITLTKYNYIEHNSNGDPFYVGVAKTMKALHFSTLVDGFGNVPYSQAFNLTKYPTPAYDDAATIYANLILQCDSAVTEFQQAITYYPTAPATVLVTDDKYDVMYGRGTSGSLTGAALKAAAINRVNEWITFCNTVKLKLLMTVRQAGGTFTSAYIHAELAKVTTNGQGYIGPNQGAAVNPGYTSSSAAQQNPFYGDFYVPAGTTNNDYAFFRANQYYINYCGDNGDDRYTDDYGASPANTYQGNYDGDPASLSNSYTSPIGPGVLVSSSQDEFILSDFESLFLQAEAVQTGFTEVSGTTGLGVSDFVREGIEQSYGYVDDAGDGSFSESAGYGDDFFAANAGNPVVDPAAGGLQAVMTQKWAALNSINWEQAYTDYRRTGYPVPDGSNFGFSHANNVVKHSSSDITGAVQPINLPYRYLYPQSEINTNGKNIPSGITAYTPIFWDKREK